MNKNTMNEIEYEQNNGDYGVKKAYPISGIIALIMCFLVAAGIWTYALNLSDPIIEKAIIIEYDISDFEKGESFVGSFNSVLVYGTASALENIESVTVKVAKSDFILGDTVKKRVPYPNGVKPVDKTNKNIELKFVTISE